MTINIFVLKEDLNGESRSGSFLFFVGYINRRAQKHSKHKTEQKHKRSTKEEPPWNGQ